MRHILSLVPKKSSKMLGFIFGGKREEVKKQVFFYCCRGLSVVNLPV